MEKCMTYPKSEGYISAKDMAGRAAYYKVLQAAKNGKLTRIKRGVYATDDHLASQMLDVEKVVPGGVLCLYSAWSHYQHKCHKIIVLPSKEGGKSHFQIIPQSHYTIGVIPPLTLEL